MRTIEVNRCSFLMKSKTIPYTLLPFIFTWNLSYLLGLMLLKKVIRKLMSKWDKWIFVSCKMLDFHYKLPSKNTHDTALKFQLNLSIQKHFVTHWHTFNEIKGERRTSCLEIVTGEVKLRVKLQKDIPKNIFRCDTLHDNKIFLWNLIAQFFKSWKSNFRWTHKKLSHSYAATPSMCLVNSRKLSST